MSAAPRVRALALHAEYRCGSSGACCTSGWEIPVEPDTEARLRSALRSGALRVPAALRSGEDLLQRGVGLPHGARAALGCDARGHCLFFETAGGNHCAIHSQLGEEALPSACRHFPRVVRLTPRGVDVSLSSYCPTVAKQLFAELPAAGSADPLLRIVEEPPAFPRPWPYQGLDAREAVPPLLRPGVLMSWEGHEAWEAHAVAVMAGAVRSGAGAAEDALETLRADAERIRAWTPRDGDFDRFLERELARSEAPPDSVRADTAKTSGRAEERSLETWDAVAATVPASQRSRLPTSRARKRFGSGATKLAEGWPRFAVPVRRWLAGKAFASWIALQGEGLRTSVLGLRLALDVLRAEALRGCGAERALDDELLCEAFRRADLLLLHLADPEAWARRLSRCERPGSDL